MGCVALLVAGCHEETNTENSESARPDVGAFDQTTDSPDTDGLDGDAAGDWAVVGPSYPLDDVLRLNHIQMKGSHNSYHIEPEDPLDESWMYTHAPLPIQLSEQGVRCFEIDVHYRPEGFLVHHLPSIDETSTCDVFVDCLWEMRHWSDENPGHHPLIVFVEPKDDIDFDHPITGHFGELDEEILSVWPREQLLVPGDLIGDHPDLATAIQADGWPTLGETRNTAVFILLDSEAHRAEYMAGESGLRDRVMFVDADPEDPFAAFVAFGSYLGHEDRFRLAVDSGFIVRASLDGANSTAAIDNDRTELEAALESGAHLIVTDYPSQLPGSDYWVDLPGGQPSRCNPATAPESCTSEDVENLLPAE